MNKELIRQRFARNLKTYNDNAKIQKHMAEKLLSYIDKKSFANILEIGCGSGLLTGMVSKNIDYKSYAAVDIVSECELCIKKIDANINFVCADAESGMSTQKYDLIISNAAFQWFEKPEEMINQLLLKLRPDGVLAFSTFGKDNFKEIFEVTGKTLSYLSKSELENLIEGYQYKTDEEELTLEFNTPRDILKHLKFTGVNSLDDRTWTKSDLKNFEDKYRQICPEVYTLTYNPVYIIIKAR